MHAGLRRRKFRLRQQSAFPSSQICCALFKLSSLTFPCEARAAGYTDVTDVSGSFYEPPASGTAFTFKADSFTNSGTIANVPEPTSGLLMLVGLAGLALRRGRRY